MQSVIRVPHATRIAIEKATTEFYKLIEAKDHAAALAELNLIRYKAEQELKKIAPPTPTKRTKRHTKPTGDTNAK